jgi:hypothetical protein
MVLQYVEKPENIKCVWIVTMFIFSNDQIHIACQINYNENMKKNELRELIKG